MAGRERKLGEKGQLGVGIAHTHRMYLKGITIRTHCIQGTLLNVKWWPGWEEFGRGTRYL